MRRAFAAATLLCVAALLPLGPCARGAAPLPPEKRAADRSREAMVRAELSFLRDLAAVLERDIVLLNKDLDEITPHALAEEERGSPQPFAQVRLVHQELQQADAELRALRARMAALSKGRK
jgi:hypothetical protein